MSRGSKSSLTNHRFPAFYACYLLKSARTPKATATYIGSTPSPPRRIRQHNGAISQGAWKTKNGRPWVMQMIVHGFPSKLAALQFEWAWQHPHISRHLRDGDGKAVFTHSGKFKYLTTNVRVARSMVSSHPYNTWPLRIKLFTEEAEKAWDSAAKVAGIPSLPSGLGVTTELEGVDGKSGMPGSSRSGPIDVTDAHFTSEHLRKASAVFLPGRDLRCSICHEPVKHDADPLRIALCPTSSCIAVSHLTCLSRGFLDSEASTSTAAIIPRGGTCRSCHSYILWGDIIRGCYRRHEGGVTPDAELEDGDEQEDFEQLFSGRLENDNTTGITSKPTKVAQPRTKKRTAPTASTLRPAQFSTLAPHLPCGEREHFYLGAISSSDEQDSEDEHPQWHAMLPSKVPRSSRSNLPEVPSTATRGARPEEMTEPGSDISSHIATGYSAGIVAGEQDGRPIAAAAGPVSNKARARGNASTQSATQMSRKPHSADIASIHTVDPPESSEHRSTERMSCPPPPIRDNTMHRTTRALRMKESFDVARDGPVKPTSRPFPDVPPLSQPPRPMNARGPREEGFDNEVVEISD